MNLKITNIQISSYAENKNLPNLQYLADKLCEDNDMEYVLAQSKSHASLDKIDVTNLSSIYTKLKDYPYEFEINSSLQLASIDGVKVATTPTNDDDTIVSMTKAELKSLIASEVSSQLSNNLSSSSNSNYSTEEQVVGTWIDGKKIYRKTLIANNLSIVPTQSTNRYSSSVDLTQPEMETLLSVEGRIKYEESSVSHTLQVGATTMDPNKFVQRTVICQDNKLSFNSQYPNDQLTGYTLVIEYTKTTDSVIN